MFLELPICKLLIIRKTFTNVESEYNERTPKVDALSYEITPRTKSIQNLPAKLYRFLLLLL